VTNYVIYCDESCYDPSGIHRFMGIGGLKVPRSTKKDLSRALSLLMRQLELRAEVKWSKVSTKRYEAYRSLIDFFFAQPMLSFRVLIVEQPKIRMHLHDDDSELAFYKFYYEMLEKWLRAGEGYLILLDYKSNRGAERYTTLKTYLQNYLGAKARISDLTIIDSKQTPLAQLCDLLTGAATAEANGITAGSAKDALCRHIARKAGLTTLDASTALSESKLNIFKMDLR